MRKQANEYPSDVGIARTIVQAVVSKAIATLSRASWRLKRWSIQDTTMREPEGTGVRLICPGGHEYWGRSLRQAESEIANERNDCPCCCKARVLLTFL